MATRKVNKQQQPSQMLFIMIIMNHQLTSNIWFKAPVFFFSIYLYRELTADELWWFSININLLFHAIFGAAKNINLLIFFYTYVVVDRLN